MIRLGVSSFPYTDEERRIITQRRCNRCYWLLLLFIAMAVSMIVFDATFGSISLFIFGLTVSSVICAATARLSTMYVELCRVVAVGNQPNQKPSVAGCLKMCHIGLWITWISLFGTSCYTAGALATILHNGRISELFCAALLFTILAYQSAVLGSVKRCFS